MRTGRRGAHREPFIQGIVAAWLCLACAPVFAGDLRLQAPGLALTPVSDEEAPSIEVASGRWQSVSASAGGLSIETVRALRPADVDVAEGNASTSWTTLDKAEYRSTGDALALPDDALFGLYLIDDATRQPVLGDGEHVPALAGPILLRSGWMARLRVGDRDWTLRTRHAKQADGRLLPGSMELLAVDAAGNTSVLIGAARSMVFQRQELLWVGDLDGDQSLDALLRRVLIDGRVEFLLRMKASIGSVLIDHDQPYHGFLSGIEDSAVLLRPRHALPAPPPERFGIAALRISESEWNGWSQRPSTAATPHYDRTLSLRGEPLRITVEAVTRTEAADAADDSSTMHFGGNLLLRAHFRGHTQVLANLGALDGSDLRIQADIVDGAPAVQIHYMPHYNNSFLHYWRWSDAGTPRFRRWAVFHSQGC